MLDPATRLLRQAIFSTWSRFAADQKETRARVVKRGYWRQDQNRKRLIFDALVSHTRRALKEKVVDLKRKVVASSFTKFEQKHREHAALALEILIKRVELEQCDADAGVSNEAVCAVLKQAIELIVGADNYQSFRHNVGSENSHMDALAALFKPDESAQLEPKPVKSIESNANVVADVRDASTSYETPRETQCSTDVPEIATTSEATPALSLEIALAHVVDIYEVAVARAGSLHEIARDYFNRVYEIRTSVCPPERHQFNCFSFRFANKMLQSLLNACRASTHYRLKLFFDMWTASVDRFYMFRRYLLTLLKQIPSACTLSALMIAGGCQVSKEPILAAIDTVLYSPFLRNKRAIDMYKRKMAKQWSVAISAQNEEASIDESDQDILDTINVDLALFEVFWCIDSEINARSENFIDNRAALCIQRNWRRHTSWTVDETAQKELWERIYDNVDSELHTNMQTRSNCFPFTDFCHLLRFAQGAGITEEVAMRLFNDWHEKCDAMLRDECVHKKQVQDRFDTSIAALSIQRQWRAVRAVLWLRWSRDYVCL